MAAAHRAQAVDLFVRLQDATAGAYPPRALLEHYYPPGSRGIERWLARGDQNRRYVFVLDDGDKVVGHVEVEELGDAMSDEQQGYWVEAFAAQPAFAEERTADRQLRLDDLAVIKRLGVDPAWQGRDIGRQLLRRAIHGVEHDLRKVPALVVLKELGAAQALYDSEGARKIGEFDEATGERMVSYIF